MAFSVNHLKALIIDDNVHMRDLLRRLLVSLGVRDIEQAADGASGLELLKMHKFDFLMSDLEMKPMDGLEFTRHVRKGQDHNPAVPIIMITGHADMERVRAARDAGINEFIVKPVTTKDLLLRITEIMERPRAFIRTATYVGPDRRRKIRAGAGPMRRKDDIPVARQG